MTPLYAHVTLASGYVQIAANSGKRLFRTRHTPVRTHYLRLSGPFFCFLPMALDLRIDNGLVVTTTQSSRVSIGIDAGRIAFIGKI